jgi:RNA polymerase sigma-70 factor (ECF subfamily)
MLSLGGDRDRIDDVLQQTWLKVLARLEQYTMQGKFRQWLFRIAHRIWLDEIRSVWERRRVYIEDNPGMDYEGLPIEKFVSDLPLSPREQAEHNESRDMLLEALENLPDQMRQALLLRIDAGLTHREISEIMGCPLGTTLWRTREGTRRLREILGRIA